MKKALKWTGIVLGALLGLILVFLVITNTISRIRLQKTYKIEIETVSIPSDNDAIREGKKWVQANCADCHGENLAGGVMIDDPPIGRVETSNLTAGRGGIGGTYSDQDWVRAIRHGVGPDGKPLLIMPSLAYYYYTDKDLGEIIAYLKSVPPVDQERGEPRITPLGHALMVMGAFGDVFSAEMIDHAAPRPTAQAPSVSTAYGEYLVETSDCQTCHGEDLTGSDSPDPDAPPAPDLSPGGNLANWTAEDFIAAMRTGVTPENNVLSKYMPWKGYRNLSDKELQAMFLYLQSLPAWK